MRYEGDGRDYSPFFVQQWEFIERHLIDSEYGGWYNETNDDGSTVRGRDKGNLWKTPYHEVRAMLHVVEMLENHDKDMATLLPALSNKQSNVNR